MKKAYSLKGFTLIELITAIALIAIIMVLAALVMMELLRAAINTDSVIMSANLARRELAVVNTLGYTDPGLADGYDSTFSNYLGFNYSIRRMVNYVSGTSNNLKAVLLRVYAPGSTSELSSFITYVMGVRFGLGSAGGAEGDEANSLAVSGGVLGRNDLTGLVTTNIRATGNITMTGVIVKSTIQKSLSYISLGRDGTDRVYNYPGGITLPANEDTLINFDYNFFMNSDIPNTAGFFNFGTNPNTTHTLYLTFLFYDGTRSPTYSWTYTR